MNEYASKINLNRSALFCGLMNENYTSETLI